MYEACIRIGMYVCMYVSNLCMYVYCVHTSLDHICMVCYMVRPSTPERAVTGVPELERSRSRRTTFYAARQLRPQLNGCRCRYQYR